MKKSQKILAALLSLCAAGGVAAIAAYLLRLPPEQEDALIERIRTFAVERAAPLAVALLSGVALILALLTPAVNRVRDAAGRFHDAVSSVQGTESRAGQAMEAMEQWKQDMERVQAQALSDLRIETDSRLSAMEERLGGCADRLDEQNRTVQRAAQTADSIRAMLLVAGTNTQELVASGKARKIRMIADGTLPPDQVLNGNGGEGEHERQA